MSRNCSRRTFLAVSGAGIAGAASAASARVSTAPRPPSPQGASTGTKIYTVLFDIAPSKDDTNVVPMTNEEILQRLQRECEGVEFVVRDATRGATLPSILNEMKDLKRQGYDGVIIYSWPRDYDLLRTGLPTINVSVIMDFANVPFPLYKQNRVISAFLDPWGFTPNPEIRERMFRDLIDKIKLIRALKQMKSAHILSVTNNRFISVVYGDVLKTSPDRYNEAILGGINETFGTKVTKIGSKEVASDKDVQNIWASNGGEARDIAQRWIRDAQRVTWTTEDEVVKSAKLYLAEKSLMAKYNATAMAFHIRQLVEKPRPEDAVYPALSVSEFQLENKVVKCQSHLNVLLSEMIMQYAYKRPSMLGDYAVDPYNNLSIVQHCSGPWNPWGDDRRVPYLLTDHRERRVRARKAPGGGAAPTVLYPTGEPITYWLVSVPNKEVLVHTGITAPEKMAPHTFEMM